MNKSIYSKKAGKVIVIAAVFIGVLSGTGLSSELLEGNLAVVSGKATNCIVITDHSFKVHSNNVMINSLSSIYDIDGKKIPLKQLKIPCIAEVKAYQSKRKPDPELIELRVKEYLQNASPQFTMKKFERIPE